MFIIKVGEIFYFLHKKTIKLLVMFFILLQVVFIHQAWATITGAHGTEYDTGLRLCSDEFSIGLTYNALIRANRCTLNVYANNYVPASGDYKVRLYVYKYDSTILGVADSTAAYIDSSKSVLDQDIHVSGNNVELSEVNTTASSCYVLVDEQGKEYALNMYNSSQTCIGGSPLPPTPPAPVVACVINNGNTLDVDLGTLDRAQLPTVPTEGKTIPVSVNCTGGAVTVNMQLNYTPITVGATEIAKSDANGLGVAIMYNSKTLSTTDITPLNFVEGGDTFDLAFQAVRDPNVAEGDVPVGQFKASATLVLTQQ